MFWIRKLRSEREVGKQLSSQLWHLRHLNPATIVSPDKGHQTRMITLLSCGPFVLCQRLCAEPSQRTNYRCFLKLIRMRHRGAMGDATRMRWKVARIEATRAEDVLACFEEACEWIWCVRFSITMVTHGDDLLTGVAQTFLRMVAPSSPSCKCAIISRWMYIFTFDTLLYIYIYLSYTCDV